MSKKLLIVLALLASISTFAQNTASGIKFEHTAWKEIVKKAKAEKKLIFMDAYTTWCGPCKMLQANVFPNKELGDYFNKNFVNAKIDMESDEGIALSGLYPVRGYPTLFFIDPNTGKIVKELLGYTEIYKLLDAGQSVVKKTKKV